MLVRFLLDPKWGRAPASSPTGRGPGCYPRFSACQYVVATLAHEPVLAANGGPRRPWRSPRHAPRSTPASPLALPLNVYGL
jgi:hypothetical protein